MGRAWLKGVKRQDIIKEVKKEFHIPNVVFDDVHQERLVDVPTEQIRYDTKTEKQTLWETIKKSCIQWITKIEYCTKWITDVKHCIKWETETKPTTEFIRNTKDTTEFIRKTKDTFEYVRKEVPYSVEELVKKALEDLVDKNAVPVPRIKYKDEIIQVFEFQIQCPCCKEKFSLGGRKK